MSIDDPRTAKTLGEACANSDGTYDGFRLLSWLSECLSPGKGVSVGEVKKIWKEKQHGRTGATQ